MRDVIVLGASGVVGRQACDVLARLDGFNVTGVSVGHDIACLERLVNVFPVKRVACARQSDAQDFAKRHPDLEVFSGDEGLNTLARSVPGGIVINALAGIVALSPSLQALEADADLYTSNKESMVSAGSLIMATAEKEGRTIIPLDSEHSAAYELLKLYPEATDVTITASGGAFRDLSRAELARLGESEIRARALTNPNWTMSPLITVETANLSNKALEVLEAAAFFPDFKANLHVLIDPKSRMHALVRLASGDVIGLASIADMHLPIEYALSGRAHQSLKRLYPAELKKNFTAPSSQRFPLVAYAFSLLGAREPLAGACFAASVTRATQDYLEGKGSFLSLDATIISMTDDERQRHQDTPLSLESVRQVWNDIAPAGKDTQS